MNRIDSETGNGICMFRTMSGSQYILKITDEKVTIKRSAKDIKFSLRKDDMEIEVLNFTSIEVGKEARVTIRTIVKGR